MTTFARTDRSLLGRWWWTVDRWTLAALVILMLCGVILIMAASPPVAERIGADSFYFVRRQFIFLPMAWAVLMAVSLLSPRGVRRLAVIVFVLSVLLLILTPLVGAEIKGARRWIALPGFSLQASEFVKPAFAVVVAWMFAEQRTRPGFPGDFVALILFLLVVGLLVLQPDFGMAATVTAIWGGQFFLAGIPLFLVAGVGVATVVGVVAGYTFLPHVAERIDRFIDPSSGDSFQVTTALRAFESGGVFGRGPGEGVVKDVLPDAHSDFIFAVAGEEFGLIVCLLIVALFAFVALRGLTRVLAEKDMFVLLAVAGLLIQFGAQAVVNMGVSLHLVPSTGMTLPFVSYGGSSLLAIALAMGMVLALTRRRPEHGRPS
jgi:cell division protein FtsW